MLVQIYIFFQIVVIGLFLASFFTRQELLWVITLVITGMVMVSSYTVEIYTYEPNITTGAYMPVMTIHTYPYLMGINMLFFGLSVILFMFDIFDKYGSKFAGNKIK